MTEYTVDGNPIQVGATLFNYYDGKWGRVVADPDSEGWFDLQQENGSKAHLNGQRVSSFDPKGSMPTLPMTRVATIRSLIEIIQEAWDDQEAEDPPLQSFDGEVFDEVVKWLSAKLD